jgi:endonuclease G
MVLDNGANDLQRISRTTRVFGAIMPNRPPLLQSHPWRTYRVTVNAVENLTGYDFFSNIPRAKQELIEQRRDRL